MSTSKLIDPSNGRRGLIYHESDVRCIPLRYPEMVRRTCCGPSDTRVLHSSAVVPDQDWSWWSAKIRTMDCVTYMKYRPKVTRSLVPLSIALAKLSGPYPPADSNGVDPRISLKGFKETSCPTDIPPSIASFSLALLNSSKRGSIRCLGFSYVYHTHHSQ